MDGKMYRYFQSSLPGLGQEAINLIVFMMICAVALGFSALNNWTVAPLRLLIIMSSLGIALTWGVTLIQQEAFLHEPQVLLFIALAVSAAIVATFTSSILIVWCLFAIQCFVAWLMLWFSLAFQSNSLF